MSILDSELHKQRETGTSTEVQGSRASSTQTITRLVDAAGVARTRVSFLREEVHELHEDATRLQIGAFETELAQATAEQSKRGLQSLLQELGRAGFSWREVARLSGVSTPAVHKWRAGGGSTSESRRRVAQMVALTQLLSGRLMIDDVASWLEIPLLSGAPLNGLDLLAASRIDLVLRWAAHSDADPRELLDEFDPSWRETYESEYEVFTAPDGLPAIRFRER